MPTVAIALRTAERTGERRRLGAALRFIVLFAIDKEERNEN
jgi:hypothetical protein